MQTVLQSEASECGLACLAMVSSKFERHEDLSQLRRRFTTSLKGLTVTQLMRNAADIQLASRALRLDVDELRSLKRPAILHWDLNHFVVLNDMRKNWRGHEQFMVKDPAIGDRKLTAAEISKHFTGVAIEFTPTEEFSKKDSSPDISIAQISGKVLGLRRAVVQAITLAAALEIFAVAAPLFNQFVIDEVLVSGDLELLRILMLGFGLIMGTQIAISIARSLFLMRWGTEIGYQWGVRLFSHLIKLPASYFERRNLGDIVSRFGSIGAIQNTMTSLLVESLLDGVMAVVALGMMLFYSPLLTAVVAVSVSVYAITRYCFYSALRTAATERIVLSARENSHFFETIRAITPLKLFGRENDRCLRWQNLKMATLNRDVTTQKISIWFRSLNGAISSIQSLALLYIGAILVVEKNISLGMLMAFVTYSATFSTRIFGLVDLYTNVKLLSIHTTRVADIALESAEKRSTIQADLTKFEGKIEVRDVSFRYGEYENWVVKDLSFNIGTAESIAIVGSSGSGKSTLCKIMLGLLQPTQGSIRVDGTEVNILGVDQYRRMVGTVMQDDVLLSGTLLENIAFFDASPDIEFAEQCARHAAIHDDIMTLPMRYQTMVGELGSSLSGGQRQRVLLARALYKRPKLLILDEATCHLDSANERKVNDALGSLGITRIVVAHRTETINATDRVFEMKDGCLHPLARGS